MKKKQDRMKIIRGNFIGILIIGIVLICVGIAFGNSDGGSGWAYSVNKRKQEDQKTGLICLGVGIATMIGAGFYYDHAKGNYLRDQEIVSSIKSANKTETTADKLTELKDMFDKNMITEEEYENKKNELLNKM